MPGNNVIRIGIGISREIEKRAKNGEKKGAKGDNGASQ